MLTNNSKSYIIVKQFEESLIGGAIMAVPKHKVSKQAGNSRFANWKIKNPSISECPQCHELKQNHRVCRYCGYYDGAKKVEVKKAND